MGLLHARTLLDTISLRACFKAGFLNLTLFECLPAAIPPTPEMCPKIERNWLFPSDEAYSEAENILRVNQKSFTAYSIRDRVLNKVGMGG